MDDVKQLTETTIWVAGSLFQRGKTSGSTANISFRRGDEVYISASGTCFATLTAGDFSVVSIDGSHISGPKPSKELPLHMAVYQARPKVGAVIHTHSFYSTLWSCLKHKDERDVVPTHTPYLKMKVGRIGLVPYAPPGSEELFAKFRKVIDDSDAWLLANHGPVVGGATMMDAFFGLEELEESARIAWHLRGEADATFIE